jgi:CRP/FNR family transcriptional regulator, nitrogen fixation regulation protein
MTKSANIQELAMHIHSADRLAIAPRRPSRPVADHAGHTLFGSPELIGTPMSFSRDAEIYGENEPADYVYLILSGTVRVYKILQDGRRQIEGFYHAGDVFGIEFGAEHASSAEAVSPVSVSVVRRTSVLSIAAQDRNVADKLWSLTGRELEHARGHAMLLVKTAQERVASFLIGMANRLTGNVVELPMSRQDIADYLGLTIETVSRTLTQFQQASAIELPSSRRMILRDREALLSLNA